MSVDVRLVIVGLGKMGSHHLRVFRGTAGVRVVAAVDAAGEDAAEPGLLVVRSLAELAVPYDAAVVATPTATHHAVARRLLSDGKHLLVEKPLAATSAEASELVALGRAQGAKLAVGHVERWNPAVRALSQLLRRGALGKITHVACQRTGPPPRKQRAASSVVLDLAVHNLDVLRCLLGPLRLVDSHCRQSSSGTIDAADLTLRAPGGATATVHASWAEGARERNLRVTGTLGVCVVDYLAQTCAVVSGDEGAPLRVAGEEPLRAQANAFARLLREGAAADLCTGEDALAAVRLAERASRGEPGVRGRRTAAAASAPSPDDEWV